MRRWPVVPTVVVGLAVATMIALGLWQLLIRLPEKEAYLARLAANPTRPAIAFPATPDDTLLFRRVLGQCRPPVSIRLAGAGAAGYRAIADCAGGMTVQLGTTRDPKAMIAWPGGAVSGYLSHAPDSRPLLASLWDDTPKAMLLVADRPPPGLGANKPPDLSAVPNSHLAYAGQWLFFALIASVIYVLALRRRS